MAASPRGRAARLDSTSRVPRPRDRKPVYPPPRVHRLMTYDVTYLLKVVPTHSLTVPPITSTYVPRTGCVLTLACD
eukprot:8383449-Pyramimonas_sp.AAC.2